jgi:colanic acid biosynthesis glycosyl transferase WcaI
MSRLLCIYQHAPTPGAPGIYRHRLYFAELVRRGWTVDLVSTPRNYMSGELPARYRRRPLSHEVIDGIDHHWVWTPGGIHRSRARRVANYAGFAAAAGLRAATLPRPDVLYISSPPLTVGLLGPLLARRFRRPWVLEVRDVWPESAVSVGWIGRESVAYRLLERLAHRLSQTADAVVVPTPGLVPFVEAHGASGVTTLTGSIVDRPPDPERRHATRKRLAIGDDECVFVYTGAIGVANGLDVLLDAVGLLPREVPARVVVAGDGSARAEIEEALRSGALDRVLLLPPVPKAEVDALLAAADVGLHLLRPDPVFESALPTKVLDYLGAHLPFITTTGGLPASVARESGGGAVMTAAELAVEIEAWTAMGEAERAARSARAFAYGAESFSLAANADRFEELLARVTRRSAR